MKIYEKRYNDEKWEAVKQDTASKVIIRSKIDNKYYEVPAENILVDESKWNICIKYHSNKLLIIYYIIFFILITVNIIGFIETESLEKIQLKNFIGLTIIYMLFFVIMHEFGHYIACKKFGKSPDKIGFKLNYIFPSFYVRMNEVYMMDKIEKLYVHSAGLMMSLFINTMMFTIGWCFNISLLCCVGAYVSMDLFMNIFPFLDSDGYKIIITLFGVNEMKEIKRSSKMIIAFKIINYCIVISYTVWFIRTVLL